MPADETQQPLATDDAPVALVLLVEHAHEQQGVGGESRDVSFYATGVWLIGVGGEKAGTQRDVVTQAT